MLRLKTGAALFITVVIAVLAYVISLQVASNDTSALLLSLPSLFVVITTISLIVTSSMVNKDESVSHTKTDKAPAKKAVIPTASESNGDIATLYIGNLAYKANEKLVQEHFEAVGTIKSVRLVKDKKTGRRKGFGFVEVSESDEAMFIEKMNETEFMERNIIVRPANEKQH